MLHKHDNFGQVPLSDMSIGKTHLKSVLDECPSPFFFFFFWKKIWVCHWYGRDTLEYPRHGKNFWERERERERENMIRTNASLFPLVLWFDMCVCFLGVDWWQLNPLGPLATPKLLLSPFVVSFSVGFGLSIFWVFDSFFLCFFFIFIFINFGTYMHVMFISPYACIGFTYLRVLFTYLIVFFFFLGMEGGFMFISLCM